MKLLDVQAILTPLGVPVLLPEERSQPLAGRRPGQTGGVSKFLVDNAAGYVQLSDASGLVSNPVLDTGFMRLEVVAASRAAAEELQDRVRAILGGTPVRPTPYRVFIPPETIAQENLFRVVTTYQTSTLIGANHVY